MFGVCKQRLHEAIKLQRQDVLKCCAESQATLILNGEDCDQITGGYRPFGGVTNPIPVNGPIGEIKYLGKLRGKAGAALFLHRIGSLASPASTNSIDKYEVVCLDGT